MVSMNGDALLLPHKYTHSFLKHFTFNLVTRNSRIFHQNGSGGGQVHCNTTDYFQIISTRSVCGLKLVAQQTSWPHTWTFIMNFATSEKNTQLFTLFHIDPFTTRYRTFLLFFFYVGPCASIIISHESDLFQHFLWLVNWARAFLVRSLLQTRTVLFTLRLGARIYSKYCV